MRGVESQGMVLMAEDEEGKLQFVKPESAMVSGAVVR
jgi:methionyl-tRNA synthetase